ncbi:MAG TPA: glutathione S-transferase family protein [Oculatellaceae cyanobacterium]|jgi:glutathione S-transferase
MVKLFYSPGTCALAPHIVLEWIGQPYEPEKVTLGSPEYKKINPLGAVPAMIDGDSGVMTQADAILLYLAHKYPEANLGDDGTSRGSFELHKWMAFFTGDVHPAFYPFFVPQRYTTSTDEATIKLTKEASYALIDKMLSHLEQHLEGKNHIVGDRRTVADPYAFAMLRWGTYLPKPLSDYPNVYRFYQQMRDDEGVKQAMAQQGIN